MRYHTVNKAPANPSLTGHGLRALMDLLHQWYLNARTRRQLAKLDERQLADAGITPSERISELKKPFWR